MSKKYVFILLRLLCYLGGRYMASHKSQITKNKSGTLERTGRAILRNPFEESDSLNP